MVRLLQVLCVAGALASSSSAMAATFCWKNAVRLCDGCEATSYWKVVVSSVPRSEIPGRPKDRPWCATGSFTSLGGIYKPAQILERPTLGEARLRGRSNVLYKSDKVGRDRMVVQYRWLDWKNNKEQTGRVTYEIEVVGAPM